jgi:hypothetical protein
MRIVKYFKLSRLPAMLATLAITQFGAYAVNIDDTYKKNIASSLQEFDARIASLYFCCESDRTLIQDKRAYLDYASKRPTIDPNEIKNIQPVTETKKTWLKLSQFKEKFRYRLAVTSAKGDILRHGSNLLVCYDGSMTRVLGFNEHTSLEESKNETVPTVERRKKGLIYALMKDESPIGFLKSALNIEPNESFEDWFSRILPSITSYSADNGGVKISRFVGGVTETIWFSPNCPLPTSVERVDDEIRGRIFISYSSVPCSGGSISVPDHISYKSYFRKTDSGCESVLYSDEISVSKWECSNAPDSEVFDVSKLPNVE